MHEYSVVRALLDHVDRQARAHGATVVHRVRVRIGELSGVEVDLFSTAWELARMGGICADARLDVVPVAARWECRDCTAEIARGGRLVCERCGGPARLAAGEEILLERLEMEVADDDAAAGDAAAGPAATLASPRPETPSPETPNPLDL